MQKFIDQLTESDRRVVRKWRLVTVAFYGSILAGMAVYMALHWNPEVDHASAGPTPHAKVTSASGH